MAAFAVEIPTLVEIVEEIGVSLAESPLGKLFRKRKRTRRRHRASKSKRMRTRKHVSVV
jgi:hypothetical protein